MGFRAPDLKKAIKVAQDMGYAVTGYQIGAGGEIRVETSTKAQDTPDSALEAWERRRNG